MSEFSPIEKQNEVQPTAAEREELERYEAWMAAHPMAEFVQDSAEECAERVRLCEALLNQFEQEHNLEALGAITHFDSIEERESSIRQPALLALKPIFQNIRHLRKQVAVDRKVLKVLQVRYEVISFTVGNIKEDPEKKVFDLVDHNTNENKKRIIWPD